MARYIDADKLALEVQRYLMPNVDDDGTVTVENAERYFLNLIKKQPTADVVEVKHGEWKQVSGKYPPYICTSCNHIYNNKEYKYCPFCGAKMDGGKAE